MRAGAKSMTHKTAKGGNARKGWQTQGEWRFFCAMAGFDSLWQVTFVCNRNPERKGFSQSISVSDGTVL